MVHLSLACLSLLLLPTASALALPKFWAAEKPPYYPTLTLCSSDAGVYPTGGYTGTTGTGTGTGTAYYPTATAYHPKRDVAAFADANRANFEGPRKRDTHPYYPSAPPEGGYYPGPTATAPSGTMPAPSGTMPAPTGTMPMHTSTAMPTGTLCPTR